MTLAWHFTNGKLRNGMPLPPDGTALIYYGELQMCNSGLHASARLIDALKYAPGSTLCRVRCGGKKIESSDKLVCQKRVIVWRRDVSVELRAFARWCALRVADAWSPPDVVMRWLNTGDDSLRSAAGSAAKSAA